MWNTRRHPSYGHKHTKMDRYRELNPNGIFFARKTLKLDGYLLNNVRSEIGLENEVVRKIVHFEKIQTHKNGPVS